MKPNADPVHMAIEYTLRQDRGRLIAALVAAIGSFELAEECLQDAVESALTAWRKTGVPTSRRGWLLQVARRRAIDQFRRNKTMGQFRGQLELMAQNDEMDANQSTPEIPDKRLELIFTCCHPALDPKSRVALTLRTVGGLTTSEIARSFLDKDATMGQRISRARAKITGAGIPFKIPGPDDWDERLDSVLTVIYLIFNEGYCASSGRDALRVDLCAEAIFLARLLNQLKGDEPEILGLLSLMLTIEGRSPARQGEISVPLDQQDRGLWDQRQIKEGLEALDLAIELGQPGPYQIKAAISALHVRAKSAKATDWTQIVMLYDSLLHHEPTPVVQLNRAVALAQAGDPKQALALMDELKSELPDYQPLFAAMARYSNETGDPEAALIAYSKAIKLTGNRADREYLRAERSKLLA